MSRNRAGKRKWKQAQARKQREAERLAQVRRTRDAKLNLTTVVTKRDQPLPKLDDLRGLGMVMPSGKPYRDAARAFEELSGLSSRVSASGIPDVEVARRP